MRKLSLALMVSLCFLGISSGASASSVDLVWSGTAGGIAAVSGNSVTVSGSSVATLTLEVTLTSDSRGVSAAFADFNFDTDFGNEVNIVSFTEISWSNTSGLRTLTPLGVGISSSQESTGTQKGTVFGLEGTSGGLGAKNTTLTFARLVFSTTVNVTNDGNDIFSQGLLGGDGTGVTIFDATFGGASVNIVPEPGTLALLVLSVGGLVLAGRRGRK